MVIRDSGSSPVRTRTGARTVIPGLFTETLSLSAFVALGPRVLDGILRQQRLGELLKAGDQAGGRDDLVPRARPTVSGRRRAPR